MMRVFMSTNICCWFFLALCFSLNKWIHCVNTPTCKYCKWDLKFIFPTKKMFGHQYVMVLNLMIIMCQIFELLMTLCQVLDPHDPVSDFLTSRPCVKSLNFCDPMSSLWTRWPCVKPLNFYWPYIKSLNLMTLFRVHEPNDALSSS